MAANIFFEARGESIKGMKSVAAVTWNRVMHKNYPGSVCAVVFQKKQFSWTHQESPSRILQVLTGDVAGMQKKDRESYKKAVDIAALPRVHFTTLMPKNVLHYHSVKVNPRWARYKVKVMQVSNHIFYRG